jgi:hypothetical protein
LVVRWAVFGAESAEPEAVGPLWEACLAEWGESSAHERLIAAASDLGLLPAVARRYRARAQADGGDGVAAARLTQIAALVEAHARAQAERPGSPRASRILWGLGYLIAGLLVVASLWLLARALR